VVSTPGYRASEDCLRELLAELRARMAPVSVAIRVGVLLRGLTVLDPDMTGPGSLELMPNLKQAAPPSRNKLATVVAATELFELGLRLMTTL
jgi:hypothetical protein